MSFLNWLRDPREWEARGHNTERLNRLIASLLSACVLTIILVFALMAGARVWR